MPPTTSNRAPKQNANASAAADATRAQAPGTPLSALGPVQDAELASLFAPLEPFATVILAVSGGADSMATMHLVARWAKLHPNSSRTLLVATVDHGLRAESAKEASWVARETAAIGLTHETLCWTGTKPSSGLQEAARNARYSLLADLGWRHGAAGAVAIVTAHTEDDQAETLLMRLARGSGLDGLTGMSPSRILHEDASCRLVRPLLRVPRARLEATLTANKLGWIEDPSNACDQFERVRLRKARDQLAEIGLTSDKLALSAQRLERARLALEAAALELQTSARLDLHGGMFANLDARVFAHAPEELRLRVLSRLVAAYGGQETSPRLSKLEALVARLSAPTFEGATLGGCVIARKGGKVFIYREPDRSDLGQVKLVPGDVGVWDHRFRVAAGAEIGVPVVVRALGPTGYATLRKKLEMDPGMRQALPPARVAAALPSFWQGSTLLAVPTLSALPGAPQVSSKGRHCSAEFLW
jgi:tRNA(Ile)-lysidine synthase